jgi:hypothetical protein
MTLGSSGSRKADAASASALAKQQETGAADRRAFGKSLLIALAQAHYGLLYSPNRCSSPSPGIAASGHGTPGYELMRGARAGAPSSGCPSLGGQLSSRDPKQALDFSTSEYGSHLLDGAESEPAQ